MHVLEVIQPLAARDPTTSGVVNVCGGASAPLLRGRRVSVNSRGDRRASQAEGRQALPPGDAAERHGVWR